MKLTQNQNGFGLVGFAFSLVAVLLAVIVGMLLVRPLFILKKNTAAPSGLHLVSTFTRACILNDQAWAATVADPENKSLECLRKNSECDLTKIVPPASYIKLKASPGAGDFCYQKFNTMPGVNTDGFTKNGVACTGYSDTGNPQCPYRFNVYWSAECPGGAKSCRNPIVRVNGDLVAGTKDAENANDPELRRYSLRTVRGRVEPVKYFSLVELIKSGQPAPGAPCKPEGSIRVFTGAFDPGGYVALNKDGTISLNPGTYSCHISVPGYRVGSFKTSLVDVTKAPPTPRLLGTSEFSPALNNYAQTRSIITGSLTVHEKSKLAVMQFCNGSAPEPKEKLRSMGVPVGGRVPWPEVYSTMECWVL